ncbi:UNVERIFIED_CONTAM: hypothetical protein HDU68_007482 [Siphonaria sp. JEL0065]|nr:hypothetical protein HDU68_007482 [Siphonaria sp. JEL0065]
MDGSTGFDLDGLQRRYEGEVVMNEVAWRLAVLNRQHLVSEEFGGKGCKELLQRALDVYREKFTV